VFDNFLDEATCIKLYEECVSAPRGGWTVFTRSGSRMEEYRDLIYTPIAHNITYDLMHSGEMIYDLEQMTGIVGLLPDPHIVGAGFSIIRPGDSLKCHYDFNWNDRLRLHRTLSSILFLTPDWSEEWGGHHECWSDNIDNNTNSKLLYDVAPLFNRLIVKENVTGKIKDWHSVRTVNSPNKISRCAIRFFYYLSNSTYNKDDMPHKSVYASNEYTHFKLWEE